MAEIKKAFEEAAKIAAEAALDATTRGLSDITSNGWLNLEQQLRVGADIVSNATETITPQALQEMYGNFSKIDIEYIDDALLSSGNTYIAGIGNLTAAADSLLLTQLATRVFQDGYTFSERIWNLFDADGLPIGINGDYQYRIKNLILTGAAQGRDAIDIAEDIQLYVAQGRDAVFKPGRYGKLEPGTWEYRKRISKTVDWRALRLVRSELNASKQQAGIYEGIINPACEPKLYNYNKTPGNPIDINGDKNESGMRCIDLSNNSPYLLEDVPGYQHSNCSCTVEPVLMDQARFIEDLKEWQPGAGEPQYLSDWYQNIYLGGL
jgi:hypothetical protein